MMGLALMEMQLLDAIDEALLLDLADQLHQDELSAGPTPRNVMLEAAKRWFMGKYGKIQLAVCPHFSRISALLKDDYAAAVTAISDIISSICIGVSPFTVSKICLQLGLRRICADVKFDG